MSTGILTWCLTYFLFSLPVIKMDLIGQHIQVET